MKQEEAEATVRIVSVKPAYIPYICPVCRGHMTVNWGKETCGVCVGLGFIKVPLREEEGETYDIRK